MTTAVVLSGGGSPGAVQVGMLQALGERGVTPDLLEGTIPPTSRQSRLLVAVRESAGTAVVDRRLLGGGSRHPGWLSTERAAFEDLWQAIAGRSGPAA